MKIYTSEKNEDILSVFDKIKSVELCGFVSGAEFDNAIRNADLLLHVEAFDEKSIDYVKHSVSTKIADSLAIGIPLIAYGPDSISSIQHLKRNGCAYVATNREGLKRVLSECLLNDACRKHYMKNALLTSTKFHSQVNNSRLLQKLLSNIAD